MKILITAATKIESDIISNISKNIYSTDDYEFICTGIGMVNTTYNLTKKIYFAQPDFILNVGICGSFNNSLSVGSVVSVKSENFADFGIDDNGKFIQLNIFNDETEKKELICKNAGIFNLPIVKAVTVNTASGSEENINKLKNNFSPDIETMEGAAVFYVCLLNKIPFAEIRAVSNMVEPRNKSNWNIETALKNLNLELPNIITKVLNCKI
ncbi:MAG: futalosine hydrolase [Bacteroidetes bacterium CG02_land_8_20_14_3_00_31_25]|nr:futalosine hydrolase [Bacteroidota bacterium]PIV58647.1 MAG: futalosine hydrolase [Bacteroidetes bacterium CG02_land_8_20_14_3_00_31_25]PIY03582.1 MAG: futalosine hydrolase [Bacteroidetes bacterium CG_4_10_14_3_um_filter_31_20]